MKKKLKQKITIRLHDDVEKIFATKRQFKSNFAI